MFSLVPSELWWQGKATASLQHDGEITSHHGRYFGHLMVSARGVGGEMSALHAHPSIVLVTVTPLEPLSQLLGVLSANK
jgi:hypothetical protein